VEVTFDKLYDEITSPSHIAKIRLGFKNKDKYRRPFEEEVSTRSIFHLRVVLL
jgi:preprotein translocase subunit Sec63